MLQLLWSSDSSNIDMTDITHISLDLLQDRFPSNGGNIHLGQSIQI